MKTTTMCGPLGGLLALALLALGGCGVDSFFNPSIVGYWEPQPTSIPILERIDVIEKEENPWGQTTGVTPEDLVPSDLSYRVVSGDVVTVQIFELFTPGQWSTTTRRVDQGGFLKVPELGNIQAAGRTPEEIQEAIEQVVQANYVRRPLVDVVVEQGSGFTYTVDGASPRPGLYTLQQSNLRLREALAVSGGVNPAIDRIYVIRQIALSDDVRPWFERPETGEAEPAPVTPPRDIEDLIDSRLNDGGTSPGAFSQDDPLIDIDDLEPVRAGDEPAVDIDQVRQRARDAAGGTWIYVEERGEWVRVPGAGRSADVGGSPGGGVTDDRPLYVERIIEIDAQDLRHGESKYNIVVRPDDLIYIDPPDSGVVYIDGQIARAGVYSIPLDGVTLSRLVASGGGLNGLAVPSRVDLVRMVGENREAVITLDLGAIRARTEPDVWLKPNDHIIIGTDFWATPLAVVRNGFRATYGFGFLLDRNFGNDVFGVPPGFNN